MHFFIVTPFEIKKNLHKIEITQKNDATFEIETSSDEFEPKWFKNGQDITPYLPDKMEKISDGTKHKLIIKVDTKRH